MRDAHLISADALKRVLGAPRLRVLDASWHMPASRRDGGAEHEAERIEDAVFFDIDALSDRSSALPHMMPNAATFGAALGALGVSDTDDIIVYDTLGLFSAARAWFMLRAFGAKNVRVLDGGLPAWRAIGGPLAHGPAEATAATFKAAPPVGVASADEVAVALNAGDDVLDARAAARFAGAQPEPRQGLRSGHMPGAVNVPFADLLAPDQTLRSDAELDRLFRARGWNGGDAVTTCGSGVTAAVVSLALAVLGHESRLYDGSWAEWGADPDRPVRTGAV